MKEYNYTNDLGYHKKIIIDNIQNNEYHVLLFSNDTGDLCGQGKMTKQELTEYLSHYGIKVNL